MTTRNERIAHVVLNAIPIDTRLWVASHPGSPSTYYRYSKYGWELKTLTGHRIDQRDQPKINRLYIDHGEWTLNDY